VKPPAFMKMLGFTIDRADEREAVVRMDVPDALITPLGTVHGGVIAALFDTGLAIAIARRLAGPDRIATHSLTITYVAFTKEAVLFCHSRVVSLRRSVAIVEGEVVAETGALVAKALGTFAVRRHVAA
jgi:uncharacterized protein (TIGR00369 family)